MALILWNCGSQSPDRWLREPRNNHLTAAIIGGVTFDGGKGTISGAFLGCVLMGVISNAMNILQVETYIQTIITGAIIVCAVVLSNINNIRRR